MVLTGLNMLPVMLVCSMDGNVGWLVHHVGPEGTISTATAWIAMKFGTDICGVQRMNTNYFSSPLAFYLAPPVG